MKYAHLTWSASQEIAKKESALWIQISKTIRKFNFKSKLSQQLVILKIDNLQHKIAFNVFLIVNTTILLEVAHQQPFLSLNPMLRLLPIALINHGNHPILIITPGRTTILTNQARRGRSLWQLTQQLSLFSQTQ